MNKGRKIRALFINRVQTGDHECTRVSKSHSLSTFGPFPSLRRFLASKFLGQRLLHFQGSLQLLQETPPHPRAARQVLHARRQLTDHPPDSRVFCSFFSSKGTRFLEFFCETTRVLFLDTKKRELTGVYRPSTGISQMQLTDVMQRYSATTPDEIKKEWNNSFRDSPRPLKIPVVFESGR